MKLKFDIYDRVPDSFMDVGMRDLQSVFARPALIELPGQRKQPLFVSIVLHGNEDAGLLAIQELLRRYENEPLPRSLMIFVGNVEACTVDERFLDHQVDFNRAWPGSDLPTTEVHRMLADVTQYALDAGVFASIDVHNNTGKNPLYGCVCSTSPEHLYLASLFSRTVIYFTRPRGVQTRAFMAHCPSVTCECGKVGDRVGASRAADLIDATLQLDGFSQHHFDSYDVEVFHTVARIKVLSDCSIGFTPEFDVALRDDLDELNFVELDSGEPIGSLRRALDECFVVNDEQGDDVTRHYLDVRHDQIRLNRSAVPSMFTCNLDVIRQDCLGYLMERYRLADG